MNEWRENLNAVKGISIVHKTCQPNSQLFQAFCKTVFLSAATLLLWKCLSSKTSKPPDLSSIDHRYSPPDFSENHVCVLLVKKSRAEQPMTSNKNKPRVSITCFTLGLHIFSSFYVHLFQRQVDSSGNIIELHYGLFSSSRPVKSNQQ